MKNYEKPKVLRELYCPFCRDSIGVIGEQTDVFHQYTDYCKKCGYTFTVNYFKPVKYIKLGRVYDA